MGPEGTKEYRKLSPRLRQAIRDVYDMIDKVPDPILNKIDGIIDTVVKKHSVKKSDIEDYFDNELIK
tara:strand:+ start:1072 stop:1272 length:201 start_codon:yes stop_codon:yes gene_type:complete